MEDFVTISLTFAASAISALVMLLTKRVNQSRDKILEVKDAEGRTEEVVVPASSSQAEVQKLVLDAKKFEKHVGEVLRRLIDLSGKEISLVSNELDKVDFIIPELGLGFEVKNRVSEGALLAAQSLVDGGMLNHVYLIVKDNSHKTSRRISEIINNNEKVSVLLGGDDDVLVNQLQLAVDKK